MNWFALTLPLTAVLVIAAFVILPAGVAVPVAIGLVIAFLILLGCGVAFIRLNFFMPALGRGPAGRNEVALTFDDGPDPASTPALLDVLRRENVAATFFCIGERARANPEIARRIVAEGHLIGNHSEHHGWWTNFLFGSRLREELRAAQRSIESTTGAAPRHYRPPLGLMNPHHRSALRDTGLRLIGWHVRSFDLRPTPVHAIAQRIVRKVRPGSIVALHDAGPGPERVAELARILIASLRERGYAFVRVDHLEEEANE